ncbi:MAG TPA: NUDIX domain-containing protein [Candidatus Microsaccharimonas sp.]|nr:NUDIX domain-containing protein [Candidatus Microsaccharimonas sp.]
MRKIVPTDSVLIPDTAQKVFAGIVHDAYHWQQEMFDGSQATFEMLRRADTTAVICVVDGKILVLDDEQPHRSVRKSFPGGRVEATDSSILDSAKREVLEEAGYTFTNWRLVDVEQPQAKLEWFVHTYIAWDGQQIGEPQNDGGERITVHAHEFDEVKQMVLDGVEYINESHLLFKQSETLDELLALPEFKGIEIER